MNKNTEERIYNLIIEPLNTLGFDIVRLKLYTYKNKRLEILIEKLDSDEKVNIADCSKISRYISAILDVEDILQDKYFLEVSSAGIERPLIKLKDYHRFLGYTVLIKLNEAIDNKKLYKGKLHEVENDNIILNLENINVVIPFNLIQNSRIVLTEELFRQIIK